MTFRKESSIIVPEITKEEEEVLEKVTDRSDVVDAAKVTSEKVILVNMSIPPLTRFILLISLFIG